MEMQTHSGIHLTAVGSVYHLHMVQAMAQQAPVVTISTKEFYDLEDKDFAASIEPFEAALAVDAQAELVCYKYAGRVIVLLGAQLARNAMTVGSDTIEVRLVSKPALKRCKVPGDAAVVIQPIQASTPVVVDKRFDTQGLFNAPRIIDKRSQTPTLESKAYAEAVTEKPLAASSDFVDETVSAPPASAHANRVGGGNIRPIDTRQRSDSLGAVPAFVDQPESVSTSTYTPNLDAYDKHQKRIREMGNQASKAARPKSPFIADAPLEDAPNQEAANRSAKRDNVNLTIDEAIAEHTDYPKWDLLSPFEKRNVRMAKKQHSLNQEAGRVTFAEEDWRDRHFQKFGVYPGHQPGSNIPRQDVTRRPGGQWSLTGYPQTDRVIEESRKQSHAGTGLYGRRRVTTP